MQFRKVRAFRISIYHSTTADDGTFAGFETALTGPTAALRWAFCISTSYWQIANRRHVSVGEGSGFDSERLPIAAVVSDKNVPGGGASRVPFLARFYLSRGVWSELANIEKRRVEGRTSISSLYFHVLRNILDIM